MQSVCLDVGLGRFAFSLLVLCVSTMSVPCEPMAFACVLPVGGDLVRATVDVAHPRLRKCYGDALRRRPGIEGRVVVRFAVQRGGSVASAEDGGSDIGDPGMIACVVAVFAGLTFHCGQRCSPATVWYPLSFTRYPGGLRGEGVLRAIAPRLGRIRLCYAEAASAHQGSPGRIVVRLAVGASGVAEASDGGSEAEDAILVACVVTAMGQLTLPPPSEPVVFTYTVARAP